MASWLFSSIQSLSTKVLEALRGTPSGADQSEGVRKDLEKLSRMLVRIQAVLQDAEEREIHDRSVRLWLAELRGVAYRMEDVLDEFHYEVLRSIVESGDAAIESYHHQATGTKRKFAEMYASSSHASYSSIVTKALIPDGMAERIKSIAERFEEISNAHRDLHLREQDGTRLAGHQIRPPTSSYVDDRAIFGREEEKEKIISLLHPSNGPEFMVLPIVGMGGLGKTTLAQLVYNDSEFCKLFKKKAWVSVSEDFNLVRLTKAVIESVRDSTCGFSELSKLQDVLNKEISGGSLFLVLDDVWNEDKNLWEQFRVGFLDATTVRILTTTQSTKIAKIMQTTSHFSLESLPEEKCLSLFKHFALGTRKASENPNLHKISLGIVKKCRGLPLAIKVLGGIFHYEIDEENWAEVFENDILEIDENGEISHTLKVSYRKLPVHLKSCFLYLTLFPKGAMFKKHEVVRLWMAQGYITGNSRTKKTLEEIGSEYFDELQGRSLVDSLTKRNMYRLHDLVYDLARSIYLEIQQPVSEHDQLWNNSYNDGHLCLNAQQGSLSSLAPGNRMVIRTLKFIGDINAAGSIVFSEITCLRALDFKYSKLPNEIGTLKHLRYLSIGMVEMKTFPESICLLYNLQSLDLGCSNILELPESIKNLINLRYLRLSSDKIRQIPESIVLLRTLHTLSLDCCTKLTKLPKSLEQLTGLCVLKTYLYSRYDWPFGTGKSTNLKSFFGSFNVMVDDMDNCLGELENMNKLSGLLYISGLNNIGNVECCKANLASKPNLGGVILHFKNGACHPYHNEHIDYVDQDKRYWNCDKAVLQLYISSDTAIENENAKKIHESVLESLQPHKNLKALRILHYEGEKVPSWLLHSSITLKQPAFLSLEVLNLINMPNLVEWEACDDHFPCLTYLVIDECPKLLKITIPQEVEVLKINRCGCQLINISSKSKLQRILISECRELISIYYINGALSFLWNIALSSCPNLLAFSAILEESKKMDTGSYGFEEIEFTAMSEINYFNNRSAPVQGSVFLFNCPNLRLFTAIPKGAHKLTIQKCGFSDMMFPSSCMNIEVSICPKLTSIHWRSGDSSSLNQIVKFAGCPRLDYIRVPSAAKELYITSCGVQDIIFPSQSMIRILHIKHCLNLLSVNWKEVQFFKELLLENCHGLSNMPEIPIEIHELRISECGLHEIRFPIQCKIASARISHCLNLSSFYLPKNLPIIETLTVRSCPEFNEVLTIPNQVKELDISDCNVPEICLLPKSRLHKLAISRCAQLAVIRGLEQCLLISLQISRCPILQFSVNDVLHPVMQMFYMYECPRIFLNGEGKCHFYEENALADSLIASDDIKIFLDHYSERSIPLLKNSELQFLKEDSSKFMEAFPLSPLSERICQYIKLHLPLLRKLEIVNCRTVISVAGLDNLNNLKHLVISGCPELCEWKDTTLPSALWSLKLVSCYKLSCAPLQYQPVETYQANITIFISKCPLLIETCREISQHKFVRSGKLMLFWSRRSTM